MASDKLTEGIPRELAHSIESALLDVVTLLASSVYQVEELEDGGTDSDNMTSAQSRAIALISMADTKVRGVLTAIEPHV